MKKYIYIVATVSIILLILVINVYYNYKEPVVSINVSDILQIRSAPFFIAKDKGFYENNSLNVNIIRKNKGSVALQSLLDGDLDFAVAAPISLIPFLVKDDDLAVIAVMHSSDNNATIVARKNAGISYPYDLKNKRIGVQYGADSHYFITYLLNIYGLGLSDVTIVDLHHDKMLNAMKNGEVDAISIWKPYSTIIQNSFGNKVVSFPSDDIYYSILMLVTKKSWAVSHKDIVKKFLRGTMSAVEFIDTNNKEAFQIVEKASIDANPLWTEQDLKSVWGDSIFKLTLDPSLIAKLGDTFRWSKDIGLLPPQPETIDFEKFIYTEPLQELSPESVILRGKNDKKN